MDYPTEEELAELNAMDVAEAEQMPNRIDTPHSFFHNDSQLSQIPLGSSQEPSTSVNRRLFGTPLPGSNTSKRISSTPFVSNAFRIDEDEQENRPIDFHPRKRRLDDLFGDIDDILKEDEPGNFFYSHDYDENERKKARNEEEIDRQQIQKILEIRAQNRVKNTNLSKQSKLEQLEYMRKFKKQNLSEIYPNWPSIALAVGRFDRIYVRMHSEEFEENQLKEIDLRKNYSDLLGTNAEAIWTEAEKLIEKRTRNVPELEPNAAAATPAEVEIVEKTRALSDQLWVDKYRPKGYFDLLSDESTNRSLLIWLKMWDKIVFNREFKQETKLNDAQRTAASNFNKKTGRFEVGGVRFRKTRQTDLKQEYDSYGRPMQKIAVLCGPPGLGKTTLAHTIARHAGYSVREINASDDRSPECFRLALQNGTEMQTTLLDRERRPNCIILDEIDGAPSASIDFLIRFVSENKDTASKTSGNKKGKAKKMGILRRPIICICNDIYTPSLRPLRQIAFIVNFPPLDGARLAERLMAICHREKLKTNMTALLALVDKTSNDVRSCISMLQFYANTNKPLTLIDVLKSNIGQKDKHKGLFEIWSTVFQIQRPKVNAVTENGDPNSSVLNVAIVDTSLKTRVENVLSVVHSGGDYDRLVNGVHENYLNQKMPDPNMYGVAEATSWFVFVDELQALIHSQQNYAIYPYLAHSFAAWHCLFASMAWPTIVFPSKSFEYYQKTMHQNSIRTTFIKRMSVSVRSLYSGSMAVLAESVPNVRQIIRPSLRSVSLQLLTSKERSDLHHTVEVMADLGLTYLQLKNSDGTYHYQLDPDLNELCNFKAISIINELTYSNMQIIAREVELEVMRRATPRSTTSKEDDKNKKKATAAQTKALPNHLQRLQTKPVIRTKIKDVIYKDFFGRLTSVPVSVTEAENQRNSVIKSPIWYRYKEGFNNAVRKDVTMKSLM